MDLHVFPIPLPPPTSLSTHIRAFLNTLTIFCCCCCLITKLCLTLSDPMACNTPGSFILHYLSDFAQAHVHWISDAIQPSYPLLFPSPPDLGLPQYRGLFQWVSSSHQVTKVLELQLHVSPSNEYSGSISFRIAWFDVLAVQGTFKSLLQHHSLKASILQCSSSLWSNTYPYMTTGKTIALTVQPFVGYVLWCLCFLIYCLYYVYMCLIIMLKLSKTGC